MENKHWLSLETPDAVEDLLRAQNLLRQDQELSGLSVAGEGNMNVTLRAEADQQSWIVKQARPFVAKYDFIPAPIERIEYEAKFYQFAQRHDALAKCMPKLLAWLPARSTLVLEDLGSLGDLSRLYKEGWHADRSRAELETLLHWLLELHNCSRGNLDVGSFRNRKLRELNHQHIFVIPFQQPPAIDLDAVCPGLAEASLSVRTNRSLVRCIETLGTLYLGDGECLLHGDYYPGSWLATDSGIRIIDPEFCFAGPAEFDIAILEAHLRLIGVPNSQEQIASISKMVSSTPLRIDWKLVNQLAGVEVLRRILGVAQLPLQNELSRLTQLIGDASQSIMGAAKVEG